MRRFAIAAMLVPVCAWLLGAHRLACANSPQARVVAGDGISIRVEGGGWGSASKREIQSVFQSAAENLADNSPRKQSGISIIVTHAEGNPITLYEKAHGGEYQVRVGAKDRYWAQYAYQFAHELCHILSNYSYDAGASAARRNQWFEETLCETASLYALRKMSADWQRRPPYPNWAGYAPELGAYAERLVRQRHRQLPAEISIADWLRENEALLRSDPYLRDRNDVLASQLLPLFEANPAGWEAVEYLNLSPAGTTTGLREYLQRWHTDAPDAHKPFVQRVLALLGLDRTELRARLVAGATAADGAAQSTTHAVAAIAASTARNSQR